MTTLDDLRIHPPGDLGSARAIAHRAVQHLSLAARANLREEPDDSHSNLGWDTGGRRFLSQPLPTLDGDLFVFTRLSPFTLGLAGGDGSTIASLDLDTISCTEAADWLDGQLEGAGLHVASGVSLPYDLPGDVAGVETYAPGLAADALSALSAWFHFAHVHLSDLATTITDLTPGPSAVRCWPHHFDIATYVGLEEGDPETARGIGVGLSPGDESHAQPYFYINPWPRLGTVTLPDLPAPGQWLVQDGSVGGLAIGDDVVAASDADAVVSEFLSQGFSLLRTELGR